MKVFTLYALLLSITSSDFVFLSVHIFQKSKTCFCVTALQSREITQYNTTTLFKFCQLSHQWLFPFWSRVCSGILLSHLLQSGIVPFMPLAVLKNTGHIFLWNATHGIWSDHAVAFQSIIKKHYMMLPCPTTMMIPFDQLVILRMASFPTLN